MADKKISETLFEALDIIINKRLESVQKDKTILCVVEDTSKAKEGEYTVSNASAKFTAYSENVNYVVGQNVWVLIPEGDYNNEKKIIGKHVGDSSTPYIWVDPKDTYADMTGNKLVFSENAPKEYGLIANCSAPINILTNTKIGADRMAGPGHNETYQINTKEENINFLPLSDLGDYNRMGISADFRTAFGSLDPLTGSYGLLFILRTAKVVADETKKNGETTIYTNIPVVFDSTDMWGNPYGYNTAFTQSLCFDINQEEYGAPVGIACYFYQNYDFANVNGPLEYYYSLPVGQSGNETEYSYVSSNIFVSNILVSFGYAMNKVKESTLYLFSQNSKTYLVNDKTYPKTLEARFIYVDDEGTTRFAVNNADKLEEYIEQDATFKALNPSLHWYRFIREEGVSDEIAGDFWQEIESNVNKFTLSVNDLKDIEDERFKCIIWYTPEHEEDEGSSAKQWALQNRYVHSNILIFVNQDNPYDEARDLEQALKIIPKGAPNGVFNLYEASYSANNNLINPADEAIPRIMEATLFPKIKKQHMMKEVTRLAWYIPKKNTMITSPAIGRGVNEDTQWLLKTAADVIDLSSMITAYNNSLGENEEKTPPLSAEEVELFTSRINDYDIILHKNVKKENSDALQLTYYIEPTLIKYYTNNTIYASAYYHKRVYEGNNAHYELIFGSKGTNGTDYTLLLDIVKETYGPNNTVYEHPMAWTKSNDANIATKNMTLKAELFDADDALVETASYKWRRWGSNDNGTTGQELTISSIVNAGYIFECIATIGSGESAQTFTGYLIIPVRNTRQYVVMEGPSVVRYNSSGTSPIYYNKKYGLVETNGNKDYTNTVEIKSTNNSITNDVEDNSGNIISKGSWPYYPKIEKGKLVPTGMYFHNNSVDYPSLYIDIGNGVWRNPLLTIVDPYGNKFLNNWSGELIVDKDNNTIMSAVMGAGKKEDDNTFTGLLLGDLPKENVAVANKTGLLGYEHGEETYGIFDDGTMFLGKSSTAQLTFNGTDGYIQNAGYGPRGYGTNDSSSTINTNGIRINFSGATKKDAVPTMGSPYIHIRKVPMSEDDSGAEIVLNTGGKGPYGGSGWTDQYVKIRGSGKYGINSSTGELSNPNDVSTWKAQDLLHIGKNKYYLQTENYSDKYQKGFKLDLTSGTLTSYDKLTIQGGVPGQNNSILISTENQTIASLAEQANKENWRLAIGSKFGVDAEGNMFATNGRLTGAIFAKEGTIGGFSISSSKNTAFDGGHFYTNSLYSHPLNINGKDYEVGIQGGTSEKGLAFYVKRKNAGTDWIDKTASNGGSMENLFYVRNNGELYASNATIKGTITADAGSIGSWKIDGGTLKAGNTILKSNGTISGATISGGTITIGNLKITDGKLTLGESALTFSSTNAALTVTGKLWVTRMLHCGIIDCTDICGSGSLTLDTDHGDASVNGYDLAKLNSWNNKTGKTITFYAYSSPSATTLTKYSIYVGYGTVNLN